MNATSELQGALDGILGQLRQFGVEFLPRLATGLAILILGVFLAKLLARALRKTLEKIRFDGLIERVGADEVLKSLGIRVPASRALSQLLYYFLLLLFVQASARSVGLGAVGEDVDRFFNYLPQLIAALLIVVLGNLVSQLARRTVEESARSSGVAIAAPLGRAVGGLILFIVAIMAVGQLGIDTAMIRIFIIASLAGSAIAFGLSFGLGTRSITESIVAGYYARKLFHSGRPLRVGDVEGELVGITPTKALLQVDGTLHSVANTRLLDETVEQ